MTVNDLMVTGVEPLQLDMPLTDAKDKLSKDHLSGLPVVDGAGKLVGILTEYDMIVKGTSACLPILEKMLHNPEEYRKNRESIKADADKIFNLKVADVMNDDPLVLNDGASIAETFKAFSEHHKVNPIPVVDGERKILGLVSRHNLNQLLSLDFATS